MSSSTSSPTTYLVPTESGRQVKVIRSSKIYADKLKGMPRLDMTMTNAGKAALIAYLAGKTKEGMTLKETYLAAQEEAGDEFLKPNNKLAQRFRTATKKELSSWQKQLPADVVLDVVRVPDRKKGDDGKVLEKVFPVITIEQLPSVFRLKQSLRGASFEVTKEWLLRNFCIASKAVELLQVAVAVIPTVKSAKNSNVEPPNVMDGQGGGRSSRSNVRGATRNKNATAFASTAPRVSLPAARQQEEASFQQQNKTLKKQLKALRAEKKVWAAEKENLIAQNKRKDLEQLQSKRQALQEKKSHYDQAHARGNQHADATKTIAALQQQVASCQATIGSLQENLARQTAEMDLMWETIGDPRKTKRARRDDYDYHHGNLQSLDI